ncbi:MAG TPA: alpha/beta hydrolase family protein [Candidatus Acidoferrum sp.]|nr:alpha/beta hydrolase family protein [Candidatus Acidoferrum sp.]
MHIYSRRRFLVGLVALLSSFFTPPAQAAPTGRIECKSVDSKILARPVNYCVVLPPSYDSAATRKYPILYFFHGLGDNEQMFIHGGAFNLVQDLWERKQIGDFLIVTPDAAATFYINSRSGKVRYEDFLLQEFFPAIEKRYRTAAGRSNRAVSGVSMGGYGALHLAFRHPELFAAAGAHSPALFEQIPAFVAPSTRSGMRSRVLGETFGDPPDPAFWQRNSPLTLARKSALTGLKIYFDCGDHDDFGFEEGARSLDKTLSDRHIPHEAHIYPGRHDWQYFAEHLPASLEFHSRIFAR